MRWCSSTSCPGRPPARSARTNCGRPNRARASSPPPRRSRRSYLLRLTNGLCEGWRPGRSELTDEVVADLGLISWIQVDTRRRDRRLGRRVGDLTPLAQSWARSHGVLHRTPAAKKAAHRLRCAALLRIATPDGSSRDVRRTRRSGGGAQRL